ncbi:HNH endonuclease [Polaromonas sp.]|uniref:HNH endonuclease n=1 Tax=Polaromonas sp. TaxID=1869339 RepID=UPI003562DB01
MQNVSTSDRTTPMPALSQKPPGISNMESPMSKTLNNSRQAAYRAQAGLCFYCRCAMWTRSSIELTRSYDITKQQAKRLQCTAEHLRPRSEGGSDLPDNIVAACRHCNCTRHKRKIPRSADEHLRRVRSRISGGRWHPREVLRVMGLQAPEVPQRDNPGEI